MKLNTLTTIMVAAALASTSAMAASRNTDGNPSAVARSSLEAQASPRQMAPGPGFDVLYAPSEADDPAFRAAIQAFTGGAVDYLNAASVTPTAQELAEYECVMTWANSSYDDNVAFGDNLAAYVDAGGTVVLGAFAAYTSGNFLSGAIMGEGYSPVTGGTNHFSNSCYDGDGITAIHNGVTDYCATYRDILTLQGAGVQDGSYEDGEIAAAYQPGVAVIYANGAGGLPLDGNDEDHPLVVANACMAGSAVEADVLKVKVTKTFSDGNDADVDVMLSCNSGLPLEQTFTIAGGDTDGVTFIVTDIPESGADCEVTESGAPAGYTASYSAGCSLTDVTTGFYRCVITNDADDATYTVVKDWVIEGTGGDVLNPVAEVSITCDGAIQGVTEDDGSWTKTGSLGDGGTLVAKVDVGTIDEPTTCSASETITQSGVESVAEGCGEVELSAGGTYTCTFTNTVFFEGIPTLSQYGLAILALLMLGMGFVGMRRFV